MHSSLTLTTALLAATATPSWLNTLIPLTKVIIGFSLIIFVHELGHFLAAKLVGIRVDRFAVGFWHRVFGWRKGEGFTFGNRPNYTPQQLAEKGYGETDYCLKVLPFGGYVKMLGQEDIQINEQTGQISLSDDPRAFTNKTVGARMLVVSAGVIFNLLFAFLAFMAVYMMGRQALAPQIGVADVSSPAARAGLRSGDVILEANGRPVETFRDIVLAMILADEGLLRFRVQRGTEVLPEELVMQLEGVDVTDSSATGLLPAASTVIQDEPALLSRLDDFRPGDRITHVAGRPVSDATELLVALAEAAERTGEAQVEVAVERPAADDPTRVDVHTCRLPAALRIFQTIPQGSTTEAADSRHVLGLCPRQRVELVDPGGPGDEAGFQVGDVIVQWGDVLHPLYSEIVDNIQQHSGRPVRVVVLRDGRNVELTVVPRPPFRLFRPAPARVGLGFSHETDSPVVAQVALQTPAAALGLPRGAVLLSVDGQPVANWLDVVQRLRAAAGRTVTVGYRSGVREGRGQMRVPSSLVNELGLRPLASVMEINGQTRARLENGQVAHLPSTFAVQALLAQHAGQTVHIKYQPSPADVSIREADFFVQPDGSNADPWQMRILYSTVDLPLRPLMKTVQTNNPIKAGYLGLKSTGDVLLEVYNVIKSIAKSFLSARAGTAKHVAGPVGIVNVALDRARQGFPELLFFLAFLSVNLAVINFLPFPVVDGGLMVFLIIEKLKGSPLGVKTQMVATLVGLATIVLVFLLVTIKDITRIWGG